MVEKVLVIGAGFLGECIAQEFNNDGIKVFGTRLTNLEREKWFKVDIRNIDSIGNCLDRLNPDLIINCAASTNLDKLEVDQHLAFSVNSDGPKNIAYLAEKKKIRLIHISTDGIFDGIKGGYIEEDIPNPINIYGKSKFEGEKMIQKNCSDHLIIRTNFFGLSKNQNGLLNWLIQTLGNNKQIIGFSDVIFTPLEVSNLSKIIIELSQTDYKGILHLASDDALSKYQFSLLVAEKFGFNSELIKKGTSEEVNLIAKRPKNTSLSNKKSKRLVRTPMLSVPNSLQNLKIH